MSTLTENQPLVAGTLTNLFIQGAVQTPAHTVKGKKREKVARLI